MPAAVDWQLPGLDAMQVERRNAFRAAKQHGWLPAAHGHRQHGDVAGPCNAAVTPVCWVEPEGHEHATDEACTSVPTDASTRVVMPS